MADWTCPECTADPHAAPGRYCAPARCVCRHASCHAAGSRSAPREPLADVIYLPRPEVTT